MIDVLDRTDLISVTAHAELPQRQNIPNKNVKSNGRAGLKIDSVFCPEGIDTPFDTVQWTKRSASIKGDNGSVYFEQNDCEFPEGWSQLAVNVVASKYFYGEQKTSEREYSVRQLIHRVSRTIADWGIEDGVFASKSDGENFYSDLTWLMLHQCVAFNSPVFFNVGLFQQYGVKGNKCGWHWSEEAGEATQPENPYEFPQGSACFIQSVADDMEAIMDLARSEALLFKFGSGTGTDLSTIRSCREKLSGGGKPSGPLSFMRVYDQIAAVVKSGGKTRRAAKMQSLKISHPDVLEFIDCKHREEEKARILIKNGLSQDDAYSSVMYQNANLSIRVTDEFMNAVKEKQKWATHWVTNPEKVADEYEATDVFQKIAATTHACGDPGLQYDSTINKWHTCPNDGRINASNPCVTGDTFVSTTEGYRRISDIVGQSVEIVAGDGNPAFVTEVFKTGHKPVYELKTQCGYKLRLTADHRVYTLNRGDVPAIELTKDDILKLENPGFGHDFVPPAFGELIGAALGDGCISHGKDARGRDEDFFFISMGSHEIEVAHHLQGNIAASKQWLKIDDGRAHRSTQVCTTATGCRVGSSVASFIDAICEYAVLDKGALKKQLKDKVFSLDKPSQKAILQGLFTADGTVANYGAKSQYISLDSTSLELLCQTQLLLLGFGIKAKIYENRRVAGQNSSVLPDGKGGVKEYKVEQIHSLRISKQSRVVFEKEIGFLSESVKNKQLEELNRSVGTYAEHFTDRVVSLMSCGTEDVFDLTEPRTHHFVANGLLVHNCSEYMFVDDSACNLASVNLMRFRTEEGLFDHAAFTKACRLVFIAQDILVDRASYPIKKIAENSHKYRPIGLGYSNLGSLLMSLGLPYDSDESRGLCSVITALMHGAAYKTSAELAGACGPFAAYIRNQVAMHRVLESHWDAVNKIGHCPKYLKNAARELWDDVIELGKRCGYRNAQTTVLAPTGTISFLMDCDTTGIEPDIALVKYKQLAGGGTLRIVNNTVPLSLRTLGYSDEDIVAITAFIEEHGLIADSPQFLTEHLPVFDCAFPPPGGTRCISWDAHLKMMAAAQPFISGAISKTVNMPSTASVEDVANAYMLGWELGLKAIAIYRDGSKSAQPLSTEKDKGEPFALQTDQTEIAPKKKREKQGPRRERLPDTRHSMTHKFNVNGHEGYITVGLYPDGRPGELFLTMAKEGSTIGGLMDCFGTAISMSLQYGVPLRVYIEKFSHTRFEPMGYTTNPEIRVAKSLVDYIFRWLGGTFAPDSVPIQREPLAVQADLSELSEKHTEIETGDDLYASFQTDAPACDACGAICVRSGNCYLCYNCGKSMGCS